ncbi:Tn4653A-like resolvase protein [Pseudomonas putida]|nr:Tn4653A-like resolvase protein [Pseudomonas putida]AHZ78291.1 Tn4653A-like resolvase protein [Pseudomonas putida]
MQGHRIGYVRVSSFDQNPERQLEETEVSKVFTDKASGKDTQRPQLEALLSFVREGDTVVIFRRQLHQSTQFDTCCASGS